MKNYLLAGLMLTVLANPLYAQVSGDDCDEDTQDCSSADSGTKEPNKTIYPYKPFETSYIKERLTLLTENKNFVWSIFELDRRNIMKANTRIQPWGGSFWPLNQGMVGNTYQNKDYDTFIFSLTEHFSWKENVKDFKQRAIKVHPMIYSLDEKELAQLAPSEKYDILLGDTSFDLTNRVWNYAEKWGREKKWGFLSSINLPDGYRIPEASKLMALWEGICHGWAVAAGHSPRAEKTVWVTLPNGKRMPFYPNDIKALVSLMWAHSTIQDNVIFEGNRCNRKNPSKDKYGRYIDVEKDRDDTEILPRCADVHPAILHTSVMNILGIEGRSFVVDHAPKATIANQPVSGYEISYFNPMTGKDGDLRESLVATTDYAKDPFKVSRNRDATSIVGVEMKMFFVDWEFPRKKEFNSAEDDKIKDFTFRYDLEINYYGQIVGGQWRVNKKGSASSGDTKQPDFFWVVPKDWRNYFQPVAGLPKWNFFNNSLPPKEYQAAAKAAHGFTYEISKKFSANGESPKCPVFPIEGKGPMLQVDCEFKYPRPQPLIQVVDKLLEMSRL